ncbi:MAG: hypothetical protein ACJ777_04525 [Chloroflexota bacterium]
MADIGPTLPPVTHRLQKPFALRLSRKRNPTAGRGYVPESGGG